MERNNIEHLIKRAMAEDLAGIDEPLPALVTAARQKVVARKKQPAAGLHLFEQLMAFVIRLKFYQLGFSVLVISLCLFCTIDMNLHSTRQHGFSADHPGALSIKDNTVSVNSSTLLTSIPTLRN